MIKVVTMDPFKKTLLTFGYVRECCRTQNIDFMPDDIVGLFVSWLIFSDYFDYNLSHHMMDLTSIDNKYQHVRVKKHQITHTINLWYSAVGSAIIRKGAKFEWQFKVNDDIICNNIEVQVGVIDNSVVKPGESINDFADSRWCGWALLLPDMIPYHGHDDRGFFDYGLQFDFDEGDIITMILDLSQERNKNGVLSFEMNAELQDNEEEMETDNVLFDDLDVDKEYRMVVSIYHVSNCDGCVTLCT